MYNNTATRKVTLILLTAFLISSTAFIASVIDHGYGHGVVIPSPAQIYERYNSACCTSSQVALVADENADTREDPLGAADASFLNTSCHGNGKVLDTALLSKEKQGSIIRRFGDVLTLGAASRQHFNESGSSGLLLTGSGPSTPKLRFEQKLMELGPITGDPIVYDRNNLPPESVRLAPGIFSEIPDHFLPEYKEPCWRNPSGRLRCLPYFFIGGFPKCATTDLWGKLTEHPNLVKTLKEPHWWTRSQFLPENVNSYINHQDAVVMENNKQRRRDLINCDASALTFQENWKIIDRMPSELKDSLEYLTVDVLRAALPDTKIVGIVRNPTERAYSAYIYFGSRRSTSPKDFHRKISQAIKQFYRCTDEKPLKNCAYFKISPHVNTGCYSLYLRDYLKRFPRDQFFFLRSEDWSREPVRYMKEIFTFLGLDPMTDAERARIVNDSEHLNRGRPVRPMLPQTRKLLDDFYRPCNEDMARILQDEKYLWKS